MFNFIMLLVAFFLIFTAYDVNTILGLVITAIALGISFYTKFSNFCIMFAMRNYTKGNKKKAFAWFERGYKKGMKPRQKVNYAYYLLLEGRTQKAEEVYNSILAFGGVNEADKMYVKSNRAILLMKTNRLDDAIEELETIFTTYKNTNIYGTLGYAYIVKGDMEKAEKFCLEAVEYNDDNPVILDNMLQIYNKKGDTEKALEYAQRLWEKKPTFIEGNYDVAVSFMAAGKTEEARSALEAALSCKQNFLSNVTHDEVSELMKKL